MIQNTLAKNATHAGGKGEILHDWYPYLEGFSSEFVYFILEKYFKKPSLLLEPYAGVGTTPISLWRANIDCDYCLPNWMVFKNNTAHLQSHSRTEPSSTVWSQVPPSSRLWREKLKNRTNKKRVTTEARE